MLLSLRKQGGIGMPELRYMRCVQEGTNQEIGYARGRFLREDKAFLEGINEYVKGTPPMAEEERAAREAMLEVHCPGLWEELLGLADGLGVAPGDNLFLRLLAMPRAGACSQVAVMPEKSATGHLLVARSYEYNLDDEMVYCVTRVPGAYRHAGFSLFHAGRFDGMNEKGLCVTMSSCEVVKSSEGNAGLIFAAPIRTLLDRCATVDEALERLAPMPIRDHVQMMLADARGAAVVEFGPNVRAIRRPKNGYLAAFNHYQSPEIASVLPEKRYFSSARQEAVDAFMSAHEKVTLDDLKALLTAEVPSGLSCRAYSEGFGTLHASLFEAAEKRLFCCMGSPRANPWFEADLDEAPKMERVSVPYENEPAPESFWRAV
jgi:predicted choloylglycine hydrolase